MIRKLIRKTTRNRSQPIFQKASKLLSIWILMAKTQNQHKPISLSLGSFRKWKRDRDLKKKLLTIKHYDYGFLQEYQFSPSTTPPPLFRHRFKKPTKKKTTCRDAYSALFSCSSCLRADAMTGESHALDMVLSTAMATIEDRYTAPARELIESWGGEEEDSVDERAERFIERFYEDMRLQRQKSASLNELLPIGYY